MGRGAKAWWRVLPFIGAKAARGIVHHRMNKALGRPMYGGFALGANGTAFFRTRSAMELLAAADGGKGGTGRSRNSEANTDLHVYWRHDQHGV